MEGLGMGKKSKMDGDSDEWVDRSGGKEDDKV